jgi:D-glycero-D-manno-heptose 1,7-bisphosphate phosphatase
MNLHKVVLLDRDGVINEDSDDYIKSPQEWEPIAGSLEAIGLLAQHGFRVVVITNQSGVARGLFSLDVLGQIHDKMERSIEAHGGKLEGIYYCPHGPEDFCECRKPKPGMFNQVANDLGLNLAGVPAIGDSYRDLEAARSAGASPILVQTGKGMRTLARHPDPNAPVFSNLYEAVQHILLGQI